MQIKLAKTFFGRRKGKSLSNTAQQRIERALPIFAINNAEDIFNGKRPFSKKDALWLEVGFGAGEHLSWQARNNPKVNFIGCEPYVNGIARLLKDIEDHHLENIKIFASDARILMRSLPEHCIHRAFVLFPDPWPKHRHRKRRFIDAATLTTFARILKPGAIFIIATDHIPYLEWILLHTTLHPHFSWLDETPKDFGKTDFETRYAKKALESGRKSYYLRFRKNSFQNP